MNNQNKNYSSIGCPRLKASAYDVNNIRLELVKPRKRRIALTKLGIYAVLGIVYITVLILFVGGL
jgi:hypothetical protein